MEMFDHCMKLWRPHLNSLVSFGEKSEGRIREHFEECCEDIPDFQFLIWHGDQMVGSLINITNAFYWSKEGYMTNALFWVREDYRGNRDVSTKMMRLIKESIKLTQMPYLLERFADNRSSGTIFKPRVVE
jgi:hypothetical protein